MAGIAILTTELIAGAYRPPSWSRPQQFSMTCTLPAANTNGSAATSSYSSAIIPGLSLPASGAASTSGTPTTYYFDAVMLADLAQEAVGAKHPVQVGPAIVDHVYLLPARVVLQVRMSNAMQSYKQGQYAGAAPGSNKSINAYQTFLQVQASRAPITLQTRLITYQNMWLAAVHAHDDIRTVQGFNGTLHFEQLISASTTSTPVSGRPNVTDTTNSGTVSPQPTGLTPTSGLVGVSGQ